MLTIYTHVCIFEFLVHGWPICFIITLLTILMQTHVSAFVFIASHLVYNAFVTMVIMVMAHPLI
jgi:hypothetical protein